MGARGRRGPRAPWPTIVGGSASDDPRGALGRRPGRRVADELAGAGRRTATPTTERRGRLGARRARGGRLPHRRLARRRHRRASTDLVGSRPADAGRHRRPRPGGGRAGRPGRRWTRASAAAWSPSSADVYVVAPEAPGRGDDPHRVASTRRCATRSSIVDDADLEAGQVAVGAGARRGGRRRRSACTTATATEPTPCCPRGRRRDGGARGRRHQPDPVGRRHGRGRRRVARLRRRCGWS